MAATIIETPAPTLGSGIKLGQLKQKHPEYDGELWEKLDLLWRGGWAIEKSASRFILQAPRENTAYYEWRCKATSYVNYLARLVGYLTGSLFNETLNVGPSTPEGQEEPAPLPDKPFYSTFGTDCDKRGTDFSQFVRATLAKALVYRRAIIQVDLPPAKALPTGAPPQTLDQEQALGNRRAYLVHIGVERMLNWEKNDSGHFVWCVLHRIHQDRSGPLADLKEYQHEFKWWRLSDRGVAEYQVMRTIKVKVDTELTDEMELDIVQPWTATSFPGIPLLEFELPEALWAGNQAGPLCQEHFRRRSDLMGSLCRSLVEMPYVKLGPEIPEVNGAFPSEAGQNPNRGDDLKGQVVDNGQVTLGHQDEIGYAGPSGVGHEIARAELKDCREEIFASVNAMALQLENSAAAVGRSGDSKQEDKSALETLLTFMGDQVREFSQRLMTTVSEARKEKIEWTATGLTTFDQEDRTELVAEAVQLETIRIPSPTHARLYKTKLALATVPKASSDEKREITKELKDNITDEEVVMDPFERAQKMAESTVVPDPNADPDDDDPPAKKPPPGKGKPPAKGAKKPAGKK